MSGMRRVARFWIEPEPWSCWPVSPSPVSVQNCNIAEAGRQLWMSSCLTLSPKQDQLEQVAQKNVLVVSLPFFFFSWCQFGISWISFIVPLLLILSPGTIENSSLIFPPSQQVFTHIDKILLSLLFFRLNSPSSLCLSSYIRCSHSIVIFVVLCWTRSSMSVHLLSCVAQHILAALSKGEGCPPPTCWKCSPEFIFAARMHGLHVANFCPQGPVCQGPSEWQHSHPVCQLHFPVFNVYKLARGYTSSHYLGH